MWKENYPSSHALKHLTPINEYVASDLNNRSGTRLETFGIFVFPSQPTTSPQALLSSPGTQQWIESEELEGNLPTLDRALRLSLIQQNQADDEPQHWSLFVARENEPGPVYQVKGDAECMSYQPSPGPTNILQSASFSNAYNLAVVTDAQALIVKQVAENEPPPRAVNRQAVVENCQGWTI
ncbi:uncharacterized protein CIMG_12989 [Coccidioides immitis RS]|uniref:Uncharacterized protein n=1 Tax=Coccidioides immitis (strain RS) TaxID=246410 RepID=A0A0D8JU27_COCIM|nr:uncharacterized protein CIMG_12989 [Coccidioides immitis RS]KJF60471.1 hypothetical protein CIMG_12989 [Coccidioides immitis RS]TPX23325.1 hypothetical protein DIZ76_012654 [Coccidioides immitis]